MNLVVRRAEPTVAVIWGRRPLAALEVQSLIEARPWRCVVGFSALAIMSDTAVVSLHIAVHLMLVLLVWVCPAVRRCGRHRGRAAAAVRRVPASVLHRRVVARRASSSNRPAGLADASVPSWGR